MRNLSPVALIEKAERAFASARLLCDAGDAEGACNRVYYAMFDAAKAALLASRPSIKPDIGKTHSGLMSAFSEHIIKTGLASKEMGRLLKRAEEIRLVADYTGDLIELADAIRMAEQAESFLAAMRQIAIPAG